MQTTLGIIMDPIATISPKKDSSFAMLLEAERRGWSIYYMEQKHLFLQDGVVRATMQRLHVKDDPVHWFEFVENEACTQDLHQLDVILMRKDPPVDAHYLYTTYLLDLAEAAGVRVINKPQSLRDVNEKLFTAWFPECCLPTLVSCDIERLRAFSKTHHDIICKPLDGMGGQGIFKLNAADPNTSVVLETLTQRGTRLIMVQRFEPAISKGDKRILLINGEPVPYALARIPAKGETRGNLAAGGHGVGVELSARDRFICERVGPTLREKGLLFVGLDVIGDYLTEINVTSPTCIRELDAIYSLNISAQLLDVLDLHKL